jgi:hypothetical protein
MERTLAAFLARQARREELARAVAAGRMALPEAAARFAALNRLAPQVRADLFRMKYSDLSDEERYCREVIYWAEGELAPDNPAGAAAGRARLEAELRRHLQAGPLRLPAVEEAPLLDDGWQPPPRQGRPPRSR